MAHTLRPCPACAELVFVKTCVCPHCGTAKVCRITALPRTALLLGLSLAAAGCSGKGQPEYTGMATSDWGSEGAAETDSDRDGYSKSDGDCNDEDDTTFPGAPETPEDGVDSNCDGDDDPHPFLDYDEDGVTVGDGDCNDLNPAVYPGAEEIPGDGVDSNCDGEDDT